MTTNLSSLRILVLVAAMAWALPSRADIPPTCDTFDALITCAAADVGKACQGGGQCYAVSCGTTSAMTVYKCDACPAVVSAPDAGCAPGNFGTACGDGGTCSARQAYCNTSAPKYICAGPPPAKPTGPPAGESGGAGGGGTAGSGGSAGSGGYAGVDGLCPSCGSKGGGCDVAPRATGPGAIALGLLIVGMAALFYDRRRRRRR
jgi:hypothetical protein